MAEAARPTVRSGRLSARDACAPTRGRSRSPPAATPSGSRTRSPDPPRVRLPRSRRAGPHRARRGRDPRAACDAAVGRRPGVAARRARPGRPRTTRSDAPGPSSGTPARWPVKRPVRPPAGPGAVPRRARSALAGLPRDEAVGLLEEGLDRPRDDDGVVGRADDGQDRLGQQVDGRGDVGDRPRDEPEPLEGRAGIRPLDACSARGVARPAPARGCSARRARVEARTTEATVAAILMRDAVFMPGPTSGWPGRFPRADGVAKR